jgi:hypothetical protein
MYTELYAAWVDMRALLKFLSDRKLSGSVMIRSGAGTGVIIMSAGELAGAYTSESRDISDKPDRALALCDDPSAMIEVKSADTVKHPPLDVDEVVSSGQRSAPRNPSPPPSPPSAPPAQPPPTQQFPVIQTPAAMPAAPPVQAPTATYPTFPTPQAAPAQVAPTTPPPGAGGPQLDWGSIVAELQAMAEDSLGNRARKQ